MIYKVQDTPAPASAKRRGYCIPCDLLLMWHVKNGPAVKGVACPKCGQALTKPGKRAVNSPYLTRYSLDGVSFDNGSMLLVWPRWEEPGDGPHVEEG